MIRNEAFHPLEMAVSIKRKKMKPREMLTKHPLMNPNPINSSIQRR